MHGLVISIALGDFKTLFAPCLRSHRAYSGRQGYTYLLIDELPWSLKPAEAAWLKVPILLGALEAGWDWVLFVDADCEVRMACPPMESEERDGKSIFMAHGFSGRYNAGVIVLRNTPEASRFLRDVWGHAEEDVPEEDRAPYENGHVIYFAKRSNSVGTLSGAWNNNSSLDPEAYIQHYSAGRLRKTYLHRWSVRRRRLYLRGDRLFTKWVGRKHKSKLSGASLQESLDPVVRYIHDELLPSPLA